ncbi:hypothetical protein [Peterkaempfera sp. SMS 1(5)a]|uniref:hypothetical protein n=1 Tax=Peterkaempfera podocarpi TaxID=3232308 RepID=UPI0036734E2B
MASGQPVTVDSLTDTGTVVTANPDGTLTRTVDSSPQRVKQNGTWVSIDTTLQAQGDGSLAPKAAATSVSFSGGGTDVMATLRDGADALGFTWPTTLPTPTVSGDTATYADVFPQVDLQLTADASGYSSILVVKTAEAANNPDLQNLTLGTQATNVTVTSTPDGGAQATDTASGAVVFHSDTATMWDSSTTGTTSATTMQSAPAAGRTRAAALRSAQAEHAASAQVGASGPGEGDGQPWQAEAQPGQGAADLQEHPVSRVCRS